MEISYERKVGEIRLSDGEWDGDITETERVELSAEEVENCLPL